MNTINTALRCDEVAGVGSGVGPPRTTSVADLERGAASSRLVDPC